MVFFCVHQCPESIGECLQAYSWVVNWTVYPAGKSIRKIFMNKSVFGPWKVETISAFQVSSTFLLEQVYGTS